MFTGPEMSAHSNPEKKNTTENKQNKTKTMKVCNLSKILNTWGTNAPK